MKVGSCALQLGGDASTVDRAVKVGGGRVRTSDHPRYRVCTASPCECHEVSPQRYSLRDVAGLCSVEGASPCAQTETGSAYGTVSARAVTDCSLPRHGTVGRRTGVRLPAW